MMVQFLDAKPNAMLHRNIKDMQFQITIVQKNALNPIISLFLMNQVTK